ncbi:MAG: AarF/ABC1/UbiB kinase family protein [Nanoarchaeota archaeon]
MIESRKKHHFIGNLLRINDIAFILIRHGLGYYVHKLRLSNRFFRLFLPKYREPETATIPYRIRLVLEDLGPSFVKLGQLLSIRTDLIPSEYAEELSKLQYSVKPFGFEEAKQIIESELKQPLKNLFQHISKEPFAAASIGQVYKAKLKNGEIVAVKVQRPNIEETIRSDIKLAKYLAELAEDHIEGIGKYNPTRIVKELENFLVKEQDYVREGRNMGLVFHNFIDDSTVKIPKVYWEYTSKKVLTTSYIQGVKLTEIGSLKISDKNRLGLNREKIVYNYFKAVTKMILEHGIYHADPHPSNVLVLRENKIAFLDFGIIGQLDKDALNNVTQMTFAVFRGDGLRFAEIILGLGTTQGNVEEFESSLKALVEYYNHPDSYDIHLSALWTEVLCLSKKYEHDLPEDYNLVFKTIITAEGTARTVYPNFNVLSFLKEYTKDLSSNRNSIHSIVRHLGDDFETVYHNLKGLPSDLRNVLKKIQHGQLTIALKEDGFRQFSVEMHKASNRITLGLVLASILTTIPAVLSLKVSETGFFIYIMLIGSLALILIILMITEVKIR